MGVVTQFLAEQINELSNLTTREWVQVKATLHALADKRFSCESCLTQYQNRADFESMTQKLRDSKGCATLLPQPAHQIENSIKFSSCIGNFVMPGIYPWLEAHAYFERGILPFPGSLMDQPAKVIQLFNVIDGYKNAQATKQAEELRRKQSGGARHGR